MKSKNKLVIIFIILLVLFAFFIYKSLAKNSKYEVNFEEINKRDYFLVFDDKYGVINKNGEIVIETNFDMIQIPNPSKDIFICMNNYNAATGNYETKVYNKNKEVLFDKYERVEAIKREENLSDIPYERSVLKYKENGKYGLIDFNGNIITKPLYESIEALEFKEGMLIVKKNGKIGVINIDGKEIINIEYDSIEADKYSINKNHNETSGFIVSVKTESGYKYGYINYKGKMILNLEYNEIARINYIEDDENVYLVAFKNGQAGFFINKKLILKHEYEDMQFDNINKLVIVQKLGKQGIFNLSGEIIIPIEYDNIIIAGNLINAQKNNDVIVFDNKGKKLNNKNFISIISTENKNYFISIDRDESFGIVDKDNNILVDNKYTFIDYLYDDYFIVQDNTKLGVININEDVKVKLQYDVLQKLEGTNVIQGIKNETVELIDKNMHVISSMKNGEIEITNNYIKIYNSKDIKYFDFDGKEISNMQAIDNQNLYAKKQKEYWGFVDKNGNIKVEYIYDMVTEFNIYGYAGIKKDGKWGIIDSQGNIILKPTYEIEEIQPQFIGKYYRVDLGYGEIFYMAE